MIRRYLSRGGNLKEDENTPEQLELFNSQPNSEEAWNQQETRQRLSTPFEFEASQRAQREVVGASDYPTSREAAQPAAKKKHLVLKLGLMLFAIAALAGTATFHSFFVYQGYQQGSCTIQSGTVQFHQAKGGGYYTPSFAYVVQPKDGQHVLTSGYDAPSSTQFSSSNEAQQVVEHYTVGRTYPCWYDPADPTHAPLVFHGYSLNEAIVLYISETPILFVTLILFFVPCYSLVYLPFRLMIKGVRTQGQVTEHFMKSLYSKQSGKMVDHPYSLIVFHLQSDPSRSQYLEESGTLPIGSEVLVMYDPSNLKKAQLGGGALGCRFAFGLGLSLFLLALVLFLVSMLWSVYFIA